ncbi:hypothetical protein AERO_08215 [Aeromicrobium fastidiosum]|uniref:hypothetical protein n=1 Tax=Aeromicrobium fastidiosum TaxID=52699 RepID=UPI0020235ED8|nr:hypothetical protein [Aeromicrobium fastidiosum]MCL8251366.1 hypothetical protein [Aeromicrobium fastidiosum]
MPEGLDATSFDFYEGIRILVPGATALAVGEGLARTLSDSGDGLSVGSVVSFFLALLIGLLFYFVDAPAKAAIFSPLQPTDVLMSWPVKPTPGTKTINSYFVMLDTVIPASIRARALYMGSMYRIGFEMIYILALPSICLVSGALLIEDHVRLDRSNFGQNEMGILLFVVLVWFVAVRRDTRPGAMRPMSELDVTSKKFSLSDLGVMIAGVVSLSVMATSVDRLPGWALAVPTAVVTTLWAFRYYKGYRRQWSRSERWAVIRHPIKNRVFWTSEDTSKSKKRRKDRHPIAGCQAVLLLGVANLFAVASVGFRPPSAIGVSESELRLWYLAMAVAIALVCARGHEKRLRGAYMTQNTWLTLNRDSIIERYFVLVEKKPKPSDP